MAHSVGKLAWLFGNTISEIAPGWGNATSSWHGINRLLQGDPVNSP